MDFGLMPPEINSGLMYAGPGSGPMLAAAAGWNAVAAELESTAGGYASELAELTGQTWFGPSAVRMTAAATPYVAWLQASAAQAGLTAVKAYAAAAAYEAAYAMTVPPPVIAANRLQLVVLVATNFLGQNTPAIAATEAQYTEMWVQDATAMYGYAADAETASTLTSFDEPPQTTNQTGLGDQARAMSQTATTTTQRTVMNAMAELDDAPDLQPGDTITLNPGGSQITLNPGVGVTVSTSSYPLGFATSTGATINVTQGSITGGSSGTGVITLPANGWFYPVGTTTFTVESGSLYALNGTANASATMTVTGGAMEISGAAGAFAWNPATGALTVLAHGSVSALPGALTPVAPAAVSGSTGGVAAVTPLASSPGLAGTAAIQPQVDVEGLAAWAQSLSGVTGAELDAGLAAVPG